MNQNLEKAIVQYIHSISRTGVTELPGPDDEVLAAFASAIEKTQEHLQSLTSSNPLPANELEQKLEASADSRPVVNESKPPMEQVSDSDTASVLEGAVGEPSSAGRLEVLKNRVRECVQCPELVSNRTQTVFGVGNESPRLCFLGEAPGAEEDVQGEPFVGAAGQLLNRIINACNMAREDVYILNTIKCRPPNNRNPLESECDQCRPFLDEQLAILKPEFICCLGGIAAKHLLNSPLSVGRLRGKVHLYQGIKVVVTYHPAYLLRNPDAKRHVWNDMKLLMLEMGTPVD